MASERIKYLAERFLNQTIKEEEKIELANWVNQCSRDEELSGVLEQAWQKHKAIKQMPLADQGHLLVIFYNFYLL